MDCSFIILLFDVIVITRWHPATLSQTDHHQVGACSPPTKLLLLTMLTGRWVVILLSLYWILLIMAWYIIIEITCCRPLRPAGHQYPILSKVGRVLAAILSINTPGNVYIGILCVSAPSQHKTFVKHLYNVGPTSSTLVQHCINVIQMFWTCWVSSASHVDHKVNAGNKTTSRTKFIYFGVIFHSTILGYTCIFNQTMSLGAAYFGLLP